MMRRRDLDGHFPGILRRSEIRRDGLKQLYDWDLLAL